MMKKISVLLLLGLLVFVKAQATTLPNPSQYCQLTSGSTLTPFAPTIQYDAQHPPTIGTDVGGSGVIANVVMDCQGMPANSQAYVRLTADNNVFASGVVGALVTGITALGAELTLAAQPQLSANGQWQAVSCPNQGLLEQGKEIVCQVTAGSDGKVKIPFTLTANYTKYTPEPFDTTLTGQQPISTPGVHLTYGSELAPQHADFLSAGDVLGVTLQAKTPTCILRQANIDVTLPDMKSNDFHQIGTTLGETPFSIMLDQCIHQVMPLVNLQLDDLYAGDSLPTGVLHSNGLAQGVGVQLLYSNGTSYIPISIGTPVTNVFLQDVGNGSFQFNLRARYYQLTQTVTAGTVHSLASFQVIYP